MKPGVLAIVVLAFSALLFASAYADSDNRIQEIGCRIDFNTAVLNSLIATAPGNSTDLQASVTLLADDRTQLTGMQNSTDIRNFNLHYEHDMQQVRQSVSQWRSAVGSHLSMSTRASLVLAYKDAQDAYDQCRFGVLKTMAQQRIDNYNKQIAKYQNVSDNWAARGFDTAQLDSLLQDAQTQLVQPMQAAIVAATDHDSLAQALNSYCLYDGCTNGTNFHLEAKFDVTKLGIVYNDLQNNSAAFNLASSDLATAGQDIADAKATLAQVGTAAYTTGQSQTIYTNVKNASNIIARMLRQVSIMTEVKLK